MSEISATPALPAPRMFRTRNGAMVGGVCTGLARHLGWPLALVRVAFVVLGVMGLLGVAVYVALWLLTRLDTDPEAPARKPGKPVSPLVLATVAASGIGLVWLLKSVDTRLGEGLFWPIAIACVGLVLVWRQADDSTGHANAAQPGSTRWAIVRVGIGAILILGAGIAFVSRSDQAMWPHALSITFLAVFGAAVVCAPWLARLQRSLNAAREAKLVADARADMAAHLHDSVLQTLALIQRQAHDAKAVSQLARTQERALRTWLYGQAPEAASVTAAICECAIEVETERGVRVEVVSVGECPMTPELEALVSAAREAMVNAAKHSGVPLIDVYLEVTDEAVEVFVRDRGVGFDVAEIGEDRLGIKRSIMERMERHGGTAHVRSTPGQGTEVSLEMPR